MLELLRSALPAGHEPSAIISCTLVSAHRDRLVLQARTRDASGAERVYAVKCYSDDIVERVWSFTQAIADRVAADGSDRLGLPIAYVKHELALVSPWIDGVPLSEVSDARTAGLLGRAARLAASLHRLPVVPEPPTMPPTLIEETVARRERLRSHWPETIPLVEPVVDAIREVANTLDQAEPAPVHGDLGGAQFQWATSRLVLSDWDLFGYTDPAFDVGHFLAQLDRICILNPAIRGYASQWIDSFTEAYVGAMPRVSLRNVAFYRAMTLLWKIHTICRTQPTDWPQLVPQFAQAARSALRTAAASGSTR